MCKRNSYELAPNQNIFTGQWSDGILIWDFEQLASLTLPSGERAYGGLLRQSDANGDENNYAYLYMPNERLLRIDCPDKSSRYRVECCRKGWRRLYPLGETEGGPADGAALIDLIGNDTGA